MGFSNSCPSLDVRLCERVHLSVDVLRGNGNYTAVDVWQIIKDLVTLFPVIRDWIVEFLDENKDMTASMVGRNMLIEQVRTSSRC